jgi:hypothetical protein
MNGVCVLTYSVLVIAAQRWKRKNLLFLPANVMEKKRITNGDKEYRVRTRFGSQRILSQGDM